jgi:two-component system, OmpR family, response regulator MprA
MSGLEETGSFARGEHRETPLPDRHGPLLTCARKILVVDDDEKLCAAIRRLLEAGGFQVRVALHGYAALNFVAKWNPEIVLTDIHMPRCDGFELISTLRSTHESVAIYAMSGGAPSPSYDVLNYAQSLGADGILRKPFEAEELLQLVSKPVTTREIACPSSVGREGRLR